MRKLAIIFTALMLVCAPAFGYEVVPTFDIRVAGGTSTFATPIDSAPVGQDWVATMGDPKLNDMVNSSVTSVAAWEAAISGTSVTISIATSDSNSTAAIAAAEYTPIWTGELFSGNTSHVVFRITPLKYLLTRCTAGITVYKLPITLRSWRGVDLDPLPYVVEEGTFEMPASGTGVSQFTAASIGAWPDGVRWAEFTSAVTPDSGASTFYTTNGDTPSVSSGFTMDTSTTLGMAKHEAKSIQFTTGGYPMAVRYKFLTAKP